jgi:pimeloyl-ACP methyl ester carboxylesterase
LKLLEKRYGITKQFLSIGDLQQCYYLFESKTQTNKSKLLMLHGAGVAGLDTWSNIIAMLDKWQYILVPDLRGMGETVHTHAVEQAFNTQQLVADVEAIIQSLAWEKFDLAGYSLGGLIAMLFKQRHLKKVDKQFLLEPGLLDRLQWSDSVNLRQSYAGVAKQLRTGNAEQAVMQFLTTISPNSKSMQSAQQLAVQRLMQRHLGFANALECVNQAVKSVDREKLVADQDRVISMIGGLSVESMHQYHKALADKHHDWRYFSIAGTDHSLPYQKPRQIARLFNES